MRQRAVSVPGRRVPEVLAQFPARPRHCLGLSLDGSRGDTARWPGSPRHTDRCRGNAVGSPSVKVGTAPDTPPWGQVLARHLLPDRLYRRAGSVTLRQLSGSPSPLRVHQTRSGRGEPEAGGRPRRATPAVWARSETPAPALESGLVLRPPAADAGHRERGAGGQPGPRRYGQAIAQYLARPISPGRDTGSNRPHARPTPAPWEGPLVSDTTELFTGSSGAPEASPGSRRPGSGPFGRGPAPRPVRR